MDKELVHTPDIFTRKTAFSSPMSCLAGDTVVNTNFKFYTKRTVYLLLNLFLCVEAESIHVLSFCLSFIEISINTFLGFLLNGCHSLRTSLIFPYGEHPDLAMEKSARKPFRITNYVE